MRLGERDDAPLCVAIAEGLPDSFTPSGVAELIPKVSPTHATATLTNHQGPAVTWVTTWDLTCTSCE